ncbi:MAG: hypothetical protein U0271_18445 [Polyangiaceae bacterium]
MSLLRVFALVNLAAFGLLSHAACSDDSPSTGGTGGEGPTPCAAGFLGDPKGEPQLQVFAWGADGANHDLSDGSTVDLIQPPQGGRVVYVSVRATNVSACGLTLTGGLRDPDSNQIRFDTRSIALHDTGDGWGEVTSGDLASYANVPVCHNLWTDKDIYDTPFTLEATLTDGEGNQATSSFSVVPTCAEPALLDECLCICEGGYTLDTVCGAGGAGGGGVGGAGGAGGA